MAAKREKPGENKSPEHIWGGNDQMIIKPDDSVRSTIAFQSARIAIRLGDYRVAQDLLNDGWLQKKYFEATFLKGMIKTSNTDSSTERFEEGLMEMLEGCKSYLNIQMLIELNDAIWSGIAAGKIQGPDAGISCDVATEMMDRERLHIVHGLIQKIVEEKGDREYIQEKLKMLAAQLKRLLV